MIEVINKETAITWWSYWGEKKAGIIIYTLEIKGVKVTFSRDWKAKEASSRLRTKKEKVGGI